MTCAFPTTLSRRLRTRPFGILLIASLTGCPYIGNETHQDNVGDDAWVDADNDGVALEDDCDDNDANAFPGNTETCDLVDNNCDGAIDEGFPDLYVDLDGDGVGTQATDRCDASEQTATLTGDCDDNEAASYPGNVESCDEIDNDCNGNVDDGLPQLYLDRDGDGFGDLSIDDCSIAVPSSTANGDCDDNDSNRYPGNLEFCDGIDNDCLANTSDAGVATLFPGTAVAPRNLDLTLTDPAFISQRTDAAELRFCQGTYNITLIFQDNTAPLLVRGFGAVRLSPFNDGERVVSVDNSEVELNNIALVDSNATGSGSGLLCTGSTVTLNNVMFSNNMGVRGAALYASDCIIDGLQPFFLNNNAPAANGGTIVEAVDTTITWSNAEWSGNAGGASLRMIDSSADLTNALFAEGTQAALFLSGESVVSLINGDFVNNAGTDVMFSGGSSEHLSNAANVTCRSPQNTCTR